MKTLRSGNCFLFPEQDNDFVPLDPEPKFSITPAAPKIAEDTLINLFSQETAHILMLVHLLFHFHTALKMDFWSFLDQRWRCSRVAPAVKLCKAVI